MIFNVRFKKELNKWYKTFAWLPTRMADDPNKIVWLGFYWKAWIVVYMYKIVPSSTTDTKTIYSKADIHNLMNKCNTCTDGTYLINLR